VLESLDEATPRPVAGR